MNHKIQIQKNYPKNNSFENFNLNRGIDVYTKNTNNNNFEMLNDRELFGQFSNANSNSNDQIDFTNIKVGNSNGMKYYNNHILNNKKNLINNPYIIESNDNTHFKALDTSNYINLTNSSSNEGMYASFKNKKNDDNNSNYSNESNESNESNDSITDFSQYSKINNDDKIIDKNIMNNDIDNEFLKRIDIIEKNIILNEYNFNIDKNKNKIFVMDIFSPFAISFLWKSLVLLSKNPTTDKLLKFLSIKKKEDIVNDMKYFSDVFADMGSLSYSIPFTNNMLNTNFIKNLYDVYKIKINSLNTENTNDTFINLNFNFELKIPFYYQPTIINDFLLDYSDNKIKFIKMLNVPCSLDIDRDLNIVNFEIPIADDMLLGFMYNLSRKNITNPEFIYNKIIKHREINKLVKNLIIPKINRHKKINYAKKFLEQLKQIHLGELIYGNLYNIDIFTNMNLDISIDNNVSNNKYQIINNIDEIVINHQCFFYLKNSKIPNKILFIGIIEY